MELQVLPDLSVPLERVNVYQHTQMKDVIGAMGGFLTPPAGRMDPRQVALEFTQANSLLIAKPYVLDMGKDKTTPQPPAIVQSSTVMRSPVGYHVQLQQTYEGIPIYGGRAIVHMTEERSVYFVTSDLHPDVPEAEMGKAEALSRQEALEALAAELPWKDRLQGEPHCEKVYFSHQGLLRLAWCIDLSLSPKTPIATGEDRSGDWRAIVDMQSGEVLQLLDIALYDDPVGRVFYPNPVVAMKKEDLAWNAAIPDSAYRQVKLSRLDDSGYLSGRYADTADTPNRVLETDGQFLYQRGQPGFLEVMAYYFVDHVINWLRRQGWPDLFRRPLRINACAPMGDQSKFFPYLWALYFGEGKVMDAEDASIILHELGHAIQEAQVKGWGVCEKNKPVRAMGEGFGDWLATVFFAEQRRTFHQGYVGDWDARGYKAPSTCLRRVDTSKTMNDWRGEEHEDGEIWSAVLWDLYQGLGGDSIQATTRRQARATAVKLVLTSHQYLSDGLRETLTFQHGLQALLDADRFTSADVTKPGPHEQLIRDVFAARGITV